ncbi:ribonuclease HII [Amphibiibacter pelophylacis]|uniref:Ribonuclease HII n=1 Tax=Amphibiibacter pelophylacis TaxID=1799477 RepID=A0ACC6P231_9BURK
MNAAPVLLVGVDEAGRGPWLGPVFAAAVILPTAFDLPGLTDSKKLSAPRRERLFDAIQAQAVAWHIASSSAAEIDQHNILQATLLAMRRAVLALPGLGEALPLAQIQVRVDGNRAPDLAPVPRAQVQTVIGGDAQVAAISAASILAKVARDRWCAQAEAQWPGYGLAQHKGYGTAVHASALATLGPCPEHRHSFAPVRRALESRDLAGQGGA